MIKSYTYEKNILMLTDNNFDTVISENPLVLVDFWAPWCNPCKTLLPIIESLAEIYKEKILFGKIDISINAEIPTRYGITSIPTLIVLKNQKLMETIIGMQEKINIQNILEKYIS